MHNLFPFQGINIEKTLLPIGLLIIHQLTNNTPSFFAENQFKMMKIKLNFEELPQATAFLLEKVEELTISINEMKQLLKRQTAAKEEMIGINEACEILSLAKPTVYALVQANKIPYYQPGKMHKFKRTELMEWMEKSRKKPIDKESLNKEIQKGVKHKPKSGWEEF